SVRRIQCLVAGGAAIEVLEQVGQVGSDEINDAQLERFFGRGRLAVDHGGPGPLRVAMATVGNGFDEGGSVILNFSLHRVIGFLRRTTLLRRSRLMPNGSCQWIYSKIIFG